MSWEEINAIGSVVGGISTALAFGGTLLVLRRDGRQIREANERRDAERRDDESRQARLVVANLDQNPDQANGDGSSVYVRVHNHSDEPIWDVQVPLPDREHMPLLYERVDPLASELNGWLDAPSDWYLRHVGPGCPSMPYWIPLDVFFVDNAGRRWRRSGRGTPERLTDDQDLKL